MHIKYSGDNGKQQRNQLGDSRRYGDAQSLANANNIHRSQAAERSE
jgi:hypothetical protein